MSKISLKLQKYESLIKNVEFTYIFLTFTNLVSNSMLEDFFWKIIVLSLKTIYSNSVQKMTSQT